MASAYVDSLSCCSLYHSGIGKCSASGAFVEAAMK